MHTKTRVFSDPLSNIVHLYNVLGISLGGLLDLLLNAVNISDI